MSRRAAAASVAALFLSGIAIGAFGMHLIGGHRPRPLPMHRPHDPRDAMEHLERLLDLSPSQREAITAILERSWHEGEAIRRDIQPRLDHHISEIHRRLLEVLTEEQRERFDALHRRHGLPDHRLFLGPPGFHRDPPEGG